MFAPHPVNEPGHVDSGVHRLERAPDNLCAALRRAARGQAGVVLVSADDREERRTWAEIHESALRRAAALRAEGLERGDVVVIVLDTSFDFVEAFYGVLLAGGTPAPAYPPVAMARLASYVELLGHIVRSTSARFIVTDARIGGAIAAVGREPSLRAILEVSELSADPYEMSFEDPSPEAPGMIQCTSGSTSKPKPVVLLHENLLANVAGLHQRYRVVPEDVLVSWLPLYHDLGLIGAFLGSVIGATELVLLSPATFLMDTGAWWRAIDRHRGTITAAPNFAYGLSAKRLDDDAVAALDLSCVKACVSGAEPIQPDTIEAFLDRMAPAGLARESFCAAYGLAECCVGVSGASPDRGLSVDRIDARAFHEEGCAVPSDAEDALRFVSVGRPYDGTRVSVRDANGHLLPERHVGEIWVAGPSVMAGYLNDAEATARVIWGGALRTGDLGYVAGGELFIAGRRKHMLIVRGRNYYAEAIESVVERVDGVRRGNAVAFGAYDERRATDLLHIAVETRLRDPQARAALERAIVEAVSDEVGLVPASVTLLPPNSLPKTSSGKKQRLECKAMVLAGKAPGRMDRARAEITGVVTLLRGSLSTAEKRVKRALRRAG